MTLQHIQAYFAARIAADATLAALGAARLYDPFEDKEVSAADIASKLRAKGVCFEISLPSALETSTNIGGATSAHASCVVFINEHPTVSHTPSKMALVDKVIHAVTQRPSANAQAARFMKHEHEELENGTLLHALLLFIPINFKP